MKNIELNNIKLIATDMDGTALSSSKELSVTSIEAMHEFMEKGGRLVISTGRAWPGVKQYAEQIQPNAPVITSNGAMIINADDGSIVRQCTLKAEDAIKILAAGFEHDTSLIIWADNILYVSRIDERTLDYGRRFGHMEPTLADRKKLEELAHSGILKILWYDTVEHANRWSQELRVYPFDSVNIYTSEPGFIECFNKEVSKGRMLEFICELYGIPIQDAAAIGDAENDIAMLKAAGLGAAMGNASDSAKAAADIIIGTNDEDGVANFIKNIIRAAAN